MGHGITIALSYMVSEQLRTGRLAPALERFTLPPQSVHLVYPHARLVAPKIRALIDFVAPRLKTALDQFAVKSWQDATPVSSARAPGRKSRRPNRPQSASKGGLGDRHGCLASDPDRPAE